MYSPRTPAGGKRSQIGCLGSPLTRSGGGFTVQGRRSVSAGGPGLLSPAWRSSLCGRSTPTRGAQYQTVGETLNYEIRSFGSSLPVKVMEAITLAEADELLSVKISENGWAWLVCGEKLIVWKIGQMPIAKLSVCKEFQLPPCDLPYIADLVALSHLNEQCSLQSVSVMAASRQGTVCYWPSLVHEESYTEITVEFGNNEWKCLTAVIGGGFFLASQKNQLLRLTPDGSGRVSSRPVQQGQGMLSGLGRRVSSLFGILTPTTDVVLNSVLWDEDNECLYTLTNSSLNKWEVDETSERHIFSWDLNRSLKEDLGDSIWGADENYEATKSGVNVQYLDLQLSKEGLVVLTAAWNHGDVPCLIYYILATVKDNGYHISDQIRVEVTEYCPVYQPHELPCQRFLIPDYSSQAAYLYTHNMVFACCTGTGRAGLPQEKLTLNMPGDGILGAGSFAGSPVLFCRNSGLVAARPKESASMLPENIEDSLALSASEAAVQCDVRQPFERAEMEPQEDKTKMLKTAFVMYCRKDIVGAQALLEEIFPYNAEMGPDSDLDIAVAQISLDLINDYPACDPRWAESVPNDGSRFSNTSLLLLHQLEDKMKAHYCLMEFLQDVELLNRLETVVVRGIPMATRLLLCEHAEKLSAAIVLKNHHTKLPDLVNAAINYALTKQNEGIPPNLTPADVFFREVSLIDVAFECLLEEEEHFLEDNNPLSLEWAQIVINVNNILKDMLHVAVHHRHNKSSFYKSEEESEQEPEYIPWTASSGPTGVRNVIVRQTDIVLNKVHPQVDTVLRNTLLEQLVALLDFYLDGYVCQLKSVDKPTQQERYNKLDLEYTQKRSHLLSQLLSLGQHQLTASLAEKYCDFDILIQLCEQTDNQTRLQRYLNQFADQNFSDFLFRWYMEKGKRGKLLSPPVSQHAQLASFLQAHEHLSWLHEINVQNFEKAHGTLLNLANLETRYFAKKKTLLSLSKLSACASDLPEDLLQERMEELTAQERYLLHQETLPMELLDKKQLNIDTMPVLAASQLISLYISDDNRSANEYDFKKALDLLNFVEKEEDCNADIDIDALKLEIFCRAIQRDDWSFDAKDDPVEAAKGTILIKVIVKLMDEEVQLKYYLPEVKDLLLSDYLVTLSSNSYFEFLLQANYEHYLKAQS